MLTRAQILARKPKRRAVDVPEWEGTVIIQELPYGIAETMTRENKLVDFVIASCINEDGTPMFSPEDREPLTQQSFAAIHRIAAAAVAFNGLSGEAVDELAKNSATGQNGASSSA